MFKYEHYNSLILYSCLLLRCEKNISNPSFDLYLIYLQLRPSGTHMFVDAGIEKLILLPSSQVTSNAWKGEGIEEKSNLWNLYSLDAAKSCTLGLYGFRNWPSAVFLPIRHFQVFFKKILKKICTEKWLVDQVWSNMFKAASVKLKAWISSEKCKDYRM